MTREIKFRYWDTKRNQMVGWESIKTFCRFGAVERMKHQIFQQYTGLKDKNGKEIYEGDEFHLGDPRITYKVVWHDTGFMGKQNGAGSFVGLKHWKNRIEIIGNIYENPELLEWKE